MGLKKRISLIEPDNPEISLCAQCAALSVSRSSFYYVPVGESAENLKIMEMLDHQYMETPFYGLQKLLSHFRDKGYVINTKRMRRLMRMVNWKTIYREPKTTISDQTHYKYPYLLRNLKIERINQVWAMDITYLPMQKGFMYLTAIIDLKSRYVINWSVSNSMSAEWCTEVLEEAIRTHGTPEIFNTDQGVQFTSELFIKTLKSNDIKISMDGRGRALDNIFIERLWRSVKYEHVYLNIYDDGVSLYKGLKKYFQFYNWERSHQTLDYKTPISVYKKVA
jgi:putative transposase